MLVVVLPLSILANGSDEWDMFADEPSADPELVNCGCHPPVLVRARDELVLWGWPIIRAASLIRTEELAVVYFAGSAEDEFAMAVRLEARIDRFSFRERESILLKARNAGLDDASIDRSIGPLVQSEGSFAGSTDRFIALPRRLKEAVSEGTVDLKTAERSVGVPEEVAELLLSAPAFLGLSFSRRRICLALTAEISRREPAALSSIVAGALESGAPDRYLNERRYPMLTEYENRFARCRDRIEGGSGLRIHAPEYFEGQAYRLEIAFRSREELRDRLSRAGIVEGYCDELFSLLQ